MKSNKSQVRRCLSSLLCITAETRRSRRKPQMNLTYIVTVDLGCGIRGSHLMRMVMYVPCERVLELNKVSPATPANGGTVQGQAKSRMC